MSAASAQPGSRGGGSRAWKAVFVIAAIVFACSAIALGVIAFSYWQGSNMYAGIADKYMADADDKAGSEGDESLLAVAPDWYGLLQVNPDTVGWVRIPNTSIDYPIVQAADNYYYLSHDFEGNPGWLANYGAIFLDCNNDPRFTDEANFVYGHHMNDGSMFAPIAEISDAETLDQRSTVYLYTPDMRYKLKAFAFVRCAADEAIVRTEFASDEERTLYVREMIDRSLFSIRDVPDAQSIDRVFAFATCDDSNLTSGRFILFCYIIDEESETSMTSE